jgi:hypothetical protein
VGARHARVCQAHSRLLKEGSSLHPLGLLVLLLALEVSRVVTTSLLVLVVVVVAATPLLNSRLALFLVGRRTGGGRDAKDVRQLPGVGRSWSWKNWSWKRLSWKSWSWRRALKKASCAERSVDVSVVRNRSNQRDKLNF